MLASVMDNLLKGQCSSLWFFSCGFWLKTACLFTHHQAPLLPRCYDSSLSHFSIGWCSWCLRCPVMTGSCGPLDLLPQSFQSSLLTPWPFGFGQRTVDWFTHSLWPGNLGCRWHLWSLYCSRHFAGIYLILFIIKPSRIGTAVLIINSILCIRELKLRKVHKWPKVT